MRNVSQKGSILFRNFTYFKIEKSEERGDPFEGIHLDNPDNDVEIKILDTGRKLRGDFSCSNEIIDSDLVYVFCLSQTYSEDLYVKFKSDACIEFTNIDEFIRRLKIKIVPKLSTNREIGLLHNPVKYYKCNEASGIDVEDPKQIPFVKNETFSYQDEYRIVFGKSKRSFKLQRSILVNSLYDFKKEALKGQAKEQFVDIGDISDITKVHYKT